MNPAKLQDELNSILQFNPDFAEAVSLSMTARPEQCDEFTSLSVTHLHNDLCNTLMVLDCAISH